MAITIYQALDFSEALVSAVEENPFFPGSESFLSSELYIKNVHKAGILEFIEDELYDIIAKIAIGGVWKDVIEAYTLENGSWVQINPKNIVINEEWKTLATFGTYDGG